MSTKPNIPEEEVDLGALFNQIGKMFSNFFNFIGNIFKSLYHYFILFLLFVRKNILVLGTATIIGIIVGFLMDLDKKPVYKSEMAVKTNYGSASLLYKQIDLLNLLISNGNSVKVANTLNIKPSQADQLLGFSVEPINEEKNSRLEYDMYMQTTDTIYTKDFKFEDFMGRISTTDLKHHKIFVYTKIPIELDLDKGIKSLVNTDYYFGLRESRVKEQKLERDILTKNIQQIDSLRKRYKEVALIEAKKEIKNNANLSLTSKSSPERNVDFDLYSVSFRAAEEFNLLNKRIFDNESIISITSGYEIGKVESSVLNKSWLRYAILGFILSLLVLAGFQFNRYLNNYKRKLEQ